MKRIEIIELGIVGGVLVLGYKLLISFLDLLLQLFIMVGGNFSNGGDFTLLMNLFYIVIYLCSFFLLIKYAPLFSRQRLKRLHRQNILSRSLS